MSDQLRDWTNYFEYTASSAGAVLAIAFFTFQYRASLWRNDPVKQAVALVTLTELATPLFFGLICLAPQANFKSAGLVVGIVGYMATAWHLLKYVPALKEELSRRRAASIPHPSNVLRKNFWTVSAAGRLDTVDHLQTLGTALTLTTWGLMLFHPNLAVKAYTSLWFIFSGLWEAWFLLRPRQDEL